MRAPMQRIQKFIDNRAKMAATLWHAYSRLSLAVAAVTVAEIIKSIASLDLMKVLVDAVSADINALSSENSRYTFV